VFDGTSDLTRGFGIQSWMPCSISTLEGTDGGWCMLLSPLPALRLGRKSSILGTILPDHANHAKKDSTIRYSFCIDNDE
jgi:hypothetical protein